MNRNTQEEVHQILLVKAQEFLKKYSQEIQNDNPHNQFRQFIWEEDMEQCYDQKIDSLNSNLSALERQRIIEQMNKDYIQQNNTLILHTSYPIWLQEFLDENWLDEDHQSFKEWQQWVNSPQFWDD